MGQKFGKKKILVGITGNLGAGKSTVARVFQERGYPVFSADVIAREIVAPGSPALSEIKTHFGPDALLADGSLNRAWMREQIARDPARRLDLEAITHPRIQRRSRELAEAEFKQGRDIVFYEAPLLFEAKSDRHVDLVVCVAASEEVRLTRVEARDGVSREQAKALMDAQMSQDEKIRRSQHVIWNDGVEADLRDAAEKVLEKLEKRA